MSDDFRPSPFGAVAVSAVILGVGNAVLVAITSGIASIALSAHRVSVGDWVGFSLATGLAASMLIAVADRPLQHAQGTNGPYGPLVVLNHLASPTLAGALVGWWICGSDWFVLGAVCALVAYLVQFVLLTPWKKTYDDADMKARSKEFAKVTRRYVEEYKEDLSELSQKKAQAKYEKNQERLKRREGR